MFKPYGARQRPGPATKKSVGKRSKYSKPFNPYQIKFLKQVFSHKADYPIACNSRKQFVKKENSMNIHK